MIKSVLIDELETDIFYLIKKLKKLKLDPARTLVIAVGRGGFMPAQYVAYGLGIRGLSNVQSTLYNDKKLNKKILNVSGTYFLEYGEYDNFIIVDDIYDSGTTLDNIIGIIKDSANALGEGSLNIIPAVVYTQKKKKKMKQKGIIYSHRIKEVRGEKPWLTFPWDNEDLE